MEGRKTSWLGSFFKGGGQEGESSQTPQKSDDAPAPTRKREPVQQAPLRLSSDTFADVGQPFARVEVIVENSPADVAGLQVDDLILDFGMLSAETCENLEDIARVVENSANQELQVVVWRNATQTVELICLIPRQWEGNGLLGCHIGELPGSLEPSTMDEYRNTVQDIETRATELESQLQQEASNSPLHHSLVTLKRELEDVKSSMLKTTSYAHEGMRQMSKQNMILEAKILRAKQEIKEVKSVLKQFFDAAPHMLVGEAKTTSGGSGSGVGGGAEEAAHEVLDIAKGISNLKVELEASREEMLKVQEVDSTVMTGLMTDLRRLARHMDEELDKVASNACTAVPSTPQPPSQPPSQAPPSTPQPSVRVTKKHLQLLKSDVANMLAELTGDSNTEDQLEGASTFADLCSIRNEVAALRDQIGYRSDPSDDVVGGFEANDAFGFSVFFEESHRSLDELREDTKAMGWVSLDAAVATTAPMKKRAMSLGMPLRKYRGRSASSRAIDMMRRSDGTATLGAIGEDEEKPSQASQEEMVRLRKEWKAEVDILKEKISSSSKALQQASLRGGMVENLARNAQKALAGMKSEVRGVMHNTDAELLVNSFEVQEMKKEMRKLLKRASNHFSMHRSELDMVESEIAEVSVELNLVKQKVDGELRAGPMHPHHSDHHHDGKHPSVSFLISPHDEHAPFAAAAADVPSDSPPPNVGSDDATTDALTVQFDDEDTNNEPSTEEARNGLVGHGGSVPNVGDLVRDLLASRSQADRLVQQRDGLKEQLTEIVQEWTAMKVERQVLKEQLDEAKRQKDVLRRQLREQMVEREILTPTPRKGRGGDAHHAEDEPVTPVRLNM